MPSKIVLTYVDTSGEIGTASFDGRTLNAANFDEQATLMSALRDATDGMTNLNRFMEVRGASATRASKVRPEDEDAQREKKWLVLYEDTVTFRQYSVEIPGRAPGLLLADPDGGFFDKADLSHEDVAAFVTAFEAYVVSPVAANPVSVLEIRAVDRNL
ncbi:MAG: hypothetical protein RBU26_11775 [Sphaerochaeta sp.]|jgi:hypothetical protein|uniref:hypothetical protein n=1 Tax=Sphaerochaeta sp. TaxID=1972642 RepID=UPI002A367B60|nr:hypothetical protein [Sphaerochaeta sp.]MDX9825607.1 hypothetical protein [Sphaerochaeta sp.]